MTAVLVIEAVAILLLGVLVVGLLRSHAEILRSLHQLGFGDGTHQPAADGPGPRARTSQSSPQDISGVTLSGSAVHVGVAGTSNTMLAFLSSGCSACIALWEDLVNHDPVANLRDTRLVVVTKGPEAESQSRLAQLAPEGVTVVQSSEAWEGYGIPVTPYFVLVEGSTGEIVGEGSAPSWGQVESLIGQALADKSEVNINLLDTDPGEFRSDAELKKAGIGPGHPSLHPAQPPTKDGMP
ncbi:MAG: hypothetical protein WBM90_12290 [Acidimicrobiia bacterium]